MVIRHIHKQTEGNSASETRGVGENIMEFLSRGNAEQKHDNEGVLGVIQFD